MPEQSLLQSLDDSLSALVPAHAISIHGAWATTTRRAYGPVDPRGTGERSFVEVIDARWTGTLTAPVEIAVMLLSYSPGEIRWVKASRVAPTIPCRVTLSAQAESPGRATFATSIAEACSHGVPIVAEGDPSVTCTVAAHVSATGRVSLLARADDAAAYFVALPRTAIKVGRNRLWRVRDEIADVLSPALRDLLTRGRTGRLDAGDAMRAAT